MTMHTYCSEYNAVRITMERRCEWQVTYYYTSVMRCKRNVECYIDNEMRSTCSGNEPLGPQETSLFFINLQFAIG
jgi:hypothetical protein